MAWPPPGAGAARPGQHAYVPGVAVRQVRVAALGRRLERGYPDYAARLAMVASAGQRGAAAAWAYAFGQRHAGRVVPAVPPRLRVLPRSARAVAAWSGSGRDACDRQARGFGEACAVHGAVRAVRLAPFAVGIGAAGNDRQALTADGRDLGHHLGVARVSGAAATLHACGSTGWLSTRPPHWYQSPRRSGRRRALRH